MMEIIISKTIVQNETGIHITVNKIVYLIHSGTFRLISFYNYLSKPDLKQNNLQLYA